MPSPYQQAVTILQSIHKEKMTTLNLNQQEKTNIQANQKEMTHVQTITAP